MKLATLFLLAALPLHAQTTAKAMPTVKQLLERIQANSQMGLDVQATVQMTQQKVGQGTKAFRMDYYRRDKDNAFMIVMSAPESDRGNGYLRVDDHFWMYRRNTRTFQHVNRDESIGGSDARGDDFETRNLTELYGPAKGQEAPVEEMLGQVPVYKFTVQAIVNDVDYPRKVYWVRRDNALTLKEEAWSAGNAKMQTAYYPKYTELQGKFIPARMIFVDEFEKGNRTVVDISDVVTRKLEDAVFTKGFLEGQSK